MENIKMVNSRPQSQALHGFRNKRKRLSTELECRSFEKHCCIKYKCTVHHDGRPVFRLLMNRPLPSSKDPSLSKWGQVHNLFVKKSFMCMRMKNHFHIKGWALNLFWYRGPGELGSGLLTFVVVFPGKTTRGDFTKPTWRIYERH